MFIAILYAALYLAVGCLISFLWHVWTLCYRGEWCAEVNVEGNWYTLCVVSWPFFLLAFSAVGMLSAIVWTLERTVKVMPTKPIGDLARKLAKRCTDFKNRNK